MNWGLFQNSILLAGMTTVLAVGMGLCVALAILGVDRRAGGFVLGAALVVLMLPPFQVINAWLEWTADEGPLRSWLSERLFSLPGAAVLMAMLYWPLTTILTLGAWQRLERGHLEIDPRLRGFRLTGSLLLPVARGALLLAVLLTAILALNHFAIPAILQVKVYPVEMWIQFNTTYDLGGTVVAALPLLAVSLAVLLLVRRRGYRWPRRAGSAEPALVRERLGRGLFGTCAAVGALVLIVSLAPLGSLLGSAATWVELPAAWASNRDVVLRSLMFASLGALAVVLFGWWTARFSSGWTLWMLFFAPGVILGVGLIFLLNRPIIEVIYQGWPVVVLAIFLRFSGIGWGGSRWIRRSLDPEQGEAARLSGAGRWQRFWDVERPQMAASLAGIWYLVYLLALWEVESLVLIVPPNGETAAMRVFNLLHYGHTGQVNAVCLLLIGLAFVPLIVWLGIRGLSRIRALCLRRGAVLAAALALVVVGCQPGAGDDDAGIESSSLFERAEILGARGAGAGQFSKPRSIAVDAEDCAYVVDMTGRVQKFSPGGDYLLSWQFPEIETGRPKGMCIDRSGRIVVVEPHYQRVNHFSRDGKLELQWGTRGTDVGTLHFPRAAAVHSSGDIYVGEYGDVQRIQRFTSAGQPTGLAFGGPGNGPGEFQRPEGLAFGPEGRLFVADSCNHRLQVFTDEGRFLYQIGKAGASRGEFSYPYDVRFDREGRLYVCEFGNSRIQVMTAEGGVLEVIGGPGREPGRFSNPWSIALDSTGNLYVADSANHRVQKLVRRRPAEGNRVAEAMKGGMRL